MSRIGYAIFASILANQPLTVVKGKRPVKIETQDTISKIQTSDLLPTLPGLTLTQQGGPLAPSEVKWRGLSGARLAIDLNGITLNDPVSGLFDVADIPFFALQSITTRSGALSFTLRSVEHNFLNTRFGYGSFSTAKYDLAAGAKINPNFNILLAAQIGSSTGNFDYFPNSIRENNDQRRANILANLSFKLTRLRGNTLFFSNWHEGGIPGLAGAQLPNLRGQHAYLNLSQDFQLPLGLWKLDTQLQGRFDHRSTWELPNKNLSVVDFTQGKLNIEAIRFFSSKNKISGKLLGELGALHNFPYFRRGFGFELSGSIPHLQTQAGIQNYSDVDTLWNAHINASMTPTPWLLMGIRLSKSARPPTFIELYAPTGLIVGNGNLHPESMYEFELYTQAEKESLGSFKLAGFYGFLQNTILFVNRSAFEITPINTSGVHRGGFSATLNLTPHKFIAIDWNTQFIASKMLSTGAPLPTVPPWSSVLTLRVGEADKICGWLKINYRDGVSSNLFGTLRTSAYWLTDLIIKIPLTSSITLNASANNIFNMLTARDSNQIPLPGRAFFISLESLSPL